MSNWILSKWKHSFYANQYYFHVTFPPVVNSYFYSKIRFKKKKGRKKDTFLGLTENISSDFFLKEKYNKDGLVNLWQLQLIEQVSGKS